VAVFRPLQRKLTIMGHHAQYKKRGSSHTGDPAPVYPLAAPEPGDWNLQPVGGTIEVKILVTPPSPATGLRTQYAELPAGWMTGAGVIPNTQWQAIAGSLDNAVYVVEVKWAIVADGFVQVSPWSTAKPCDIDQ
jgi:hypothetical protein